jgi:opacity protein-like surface antigen
MNFKWPFGTLSAAVALALAASPLGAVTYYEETDAPAEVEVYEDDADDVIFIEDDDDEDDDDFRSGVSLGGRAAYFDPKDADDTTWFGGAQLRLFFSRAMALEGSIDYREDEYPGQVQVRTYPVQATLLAFLMPDSPLSPFLLGGAGWYHTTLEVPGVPDDTDSRFGLHAGGGLELCLSEHLSLDGTYRYIWMEGFESGGADLTKKEFNDSGHMVTMGLNFYFGDKD